MLASAHHLWSMNFSSIINQAHLVEVCGSCPFHLLTTQTSTSMGSSCHSQSGRSMASGQATQWPHNLFVTKHACVY
ncbi:hypothetical protein Pfo_027411 [Paulownia fortunei]|nr:hypothetical protein Pfo_027411 [Paulownia fortunei]